ncbi:formylmethanofuran dehydrogenase subunit E [Candidatus Bathyarchaeota archaeon]|nr:formylmethanofuran dehydrogenase subunit E [Candidatus Bathyarchaeota archaeon]
MKTKIETDLKKLVEKAADFHGHLGPFLVIGVKMGKLAKETLNTKEKIISEVTAKTPLLTPFSCILDGIQATTNCTVGNQKLKIENSQKEIAARFKLQNSDDSLEATINPKVIEDIVNKLSSGVSNEELAWEIAAMPENQLFKINRKC